MNFIKIHRGEASMNLLKAYVQELEKRTNRQKGEWIR